MALAIDASSPAQASGTTSAISTASFTTPAASFLLAMVGRNNAGAGENSTGTVSGGGLTWTLAGRKSVTGTGQITGGTAQDGCAELWWAYTAGGITSQTITDTRAANAGVGYDHALKVMVLTGAETTWGGAIAANAALSAAPSVSVTTTRANSWVFAVNTDWAQAGLGTFPAGQTMISEYNNAGQITIHFWRQTAVTASSGTAVTMNQTAPSTQRYNLLAIEIREPGAAVATPPELVMAPIRRF